MVDQAMDRELLIKTTGLREWGSNERLDYNRCESTPYRALDKLFKNYKINENDKFVDFGCGRGRVALYTHHKFSIPVSGVELHDLTFDELIGNKESYKYNKKLEDAPIYFEYGYADNYDIKNDETIFYFFNPFSIHIFRKVIDNIVKSIEENKREVDIILYYPLKPFKTYIEENTPFRKINTVRLSWKKDKRKKFVIYRFSPENKLNN